MSFANLKKNSKNNFSALSKKLENEGKSSYEKDARYWNFTVDKAGNGMATIRFLMAIEGEEFPYTKIFEYAFQDQRTKRWYIEASRDTIGEPDPVSEKWSDLWNSGDKEGAKKYSRSTRYISNILVLDDPANPENNGKVFLWKYGPRIFQKLQGAIKPEFPDEPTFDPFNFWEGANFKLKARTVDKQRSYDKSEFEKPAPLFGGDDKKIEALWATQYPLLPEIAPDKFKPYDQLNARFLSVIGGAPAQQSAPKPSSEQSKAPAADDDVPFDTNDKVAPKVESKAPAGDDEDLEAYRKMLED